MGGWVRNSEIFTCVYILYECPLTVNTPAVSLENIMICQLLIAINRIVDIGKQVDPAGAHCTERSAKNERNYARLIGALGDSVIMR